MAALANAAGTQLVNSPTASTSPAWKLFIVLSGEGTRESSGFPRHLVVALATIARRCAKPKEHGQSKHRPAGISLFAALVQQTW